MARHTVPDTMEHTGASPERVHASGSPLVVSLVRSLRPSQWTKNLIIFAGLIFGQRLLDSSAVLTAVLAFIVFCALSSVVYLINDVADRHADRQHPLKRHRPIASGALSVPVALATAAVLGASALAAAFWLRPSFGVVATAYLALLGVLLRTAEARRHHRRPDDRDRVRPARRGGRGCGGRRHRPLVVDRHGAAGALPGVEQATARVGDAGRWRHQPPTDPPGIQPVPARPDDCGRDRVDAGRLRGRTRSARKRPRNSGPTSSA